MSSIDPSGTGTPNSGPPSSSPRRQTLWNQIISGIVVAVVGGLLLAGLKVVLPDVWNWLFTPRLPADAVVSFNTDRCPAGWETLDLAIGRTIIGVGKGADLTVRELRDFGGEESHTLTIDEMPAHDHGGIWGGKDEKSGMLDDWRYHTSGHEKIQMQGGGNPHNNMPPFIALLYCKKT